MIYNEVPILNQGQFLWAVSPFALAMLMSSTSSRCCLTNEERKYFWWTLAFFLLIVVESTYVFVQMIAFEVCFTRQHTISDTATDWCIHSQPCWCWSDTLWRCQRSPQQAQWKKKVLEIVQIHGFIYVVGCLLAQIEWRSWLLFDMARDTSLGAWVCLSWPYNTDKKTSTSEFIAWHWS